MSSKGWKFGHYDAKDPAGKAAHERGEGHIAVRVKKVAGCRVVLHGESRGALSDAAYEVDRALELRGDSPPVERVAWVGGAPVHARPAALPEGVTASVVGADGQRVDLHADGEVRRAPRSMAPTSTFVRRPDMSGIPCDNCGSPNTIRIGKCLRCYDCNSDGECG